MPTEDTIYTKKMDHTSSAVLRHSPTPYSHANSSKSVRAVVPTVGTDVPPSLRAAVVESPALPSWSLPARSDTSVEGSSLRTNVTGSARHSVDSSLASSPAPGDDEVRSVHSRGGRRSFDLATARD